MLGQHRSLPLLLDNLHDLRGKVGGDDEVAQGHLRIRDLYEVGDVILGTRQPCHFGELSPSALSRGLDRLFNIGRKMMVTLAGLACRRLEGYGIESLFVTRGVGAHKCGNMRSLACHGDPSFLSIRNEGYHAGR